MKKKNALKILIFYMTFKSKDTWEVFLLLNYSMHVERNIRNKTCDKVLIIWHGGGGNKWIFTYIIRWQQMDIHIHIKTATNWYSHRYLDKDNFMQHFFFILIKLLFFWMHCNWVDLEYCCFFYNWANFQIALRWNYFRESEKKLGFSFN